MPRKVYSGPLTPVTLFALNSNDDLVVLGHSDIGLGVVMTARWGGGVAEIDDVRMDAVTHALNAIDYAHHEVHAGSSFVVCDVQNVNAGTMTWQITTPNTTRYAHILFDIEATGEMLVVVTEGSDRNDGAALAEINRRRVGAPTAATVIVTRTPVGGTTDGATIIFARRVGATGVGNKVLTGGGSRGINEYILNPNTKYVVSVTTFADIYVSFCVDWYEHVDRH